MPMRRLVHRLSLGLAVAILTASLAAFAAAPAAAAPPARMPCSPLANAPVGKVYLLPASTCDVTGLAIAVHDGHFRELYGPQVYGPTQVSEILDLLHSVDGKLRDAATARLKARTCAPDAPSCRATLKVLMFAHGGLVNQDSALDEASRIAPGALADGYQPIFLIWNSGLFESYGERLCCVLEGEQSKRGVIYFLPARLFADVVGGAARVPELIGQQVLRFNDSVLQTHGTQYYISKQDPALLCGLFWAAGCQHINYPRLDDYRTLNSLDEKPQENSLGYRVLAPVRLGTTALSQVGTQDWDDMVRRTHLALQPPLLSIAANPYALIVRAEGITDHCDDLTRSELASVTDRADAGATLVAAEHEAPQAKRFDVESEGGFAIFLDHFACELQQGFGAPGGDKLDVELTYVGHSMGAIVGDEVLSSHPDLPWKRIVYMAAADSIRDFRAYVAPVLACAGTGNRDRCLDGDVQFFNLSLHPLAESHDLEYWGILPEGSLLEWIDEMFAGPTSVDERRFGKWTNVEKGLGFFPDKARARMTFRVFPAQSNLRDRKGDELALYNRQCGAGGSDPLPPRCHPIMHGQFTDYSFWRDAYLCDPGADSKTCAGLAGPPALPAHP
jgi:hypothetical protein